MKKYAIISLLLSASLCSAATRYVKKTGSNANTPCTNSASPCLTIAFAYGLANAGDVIAVIDSTAQTYSENVTLNRSGSSGNKITVQGFDPASSCPTTVSSDVNSRGFRPAPLITMWGFNVNANFLIIDCFKVDASDSAGGHAAISMTGSTGQHDIDVRNMYVDGGGTANNGTPYISNLNGGQFNITYKTSYVTATQMGFLMNSCTSNCVIQDNEEERLTGGTGGVDHDYNRVFGNGVSLIHNYWHGNQKADCPGDCHIDCVQTWNIGNSGEIAQNITIDRNYCSDSDQGIIIRDTTSTTPGVCVSHFNWTVTNNVFQKNADWNLDLEHVCNITITNNTINDSVTGCLYGSTCVIKNNIFQHDAFTPYAQAISGATDGNITARDHNLLANCNSGCTYSCSGLYANDICPNGGAAGTNIPQFINPSASPTGNYRLQSTSPAKDAGVTLSLAYDLDLGIRPQGASWDIGAFEVAASGPIAQVSPSSLPFGNILVGTTSSPLTATLSNTGSSNFTLTSIGITGDFSITGGGTCTTPISISPGTSCTVNVTFTPTVLGVRSGTLSFIDGAPGSPQSIPLNGTGTQPVSSSQFSGSVVIKGGFTIK